MSGVNMFAMAVVMKVVLGWNITFTIFVSSIAVALYVRLGGLRSAIFNEVLQFVLIWGGALLVPILGLVQAGGMDGLKKRMIANLQSVSTSVHADSYMHLWRDTGTLRPIRWAFTGQESSSDLDLSSASAIGQRTSWWCSAFWRA